MKKKKKREKKRKRQKWLLERVDRGARNTGDQPLQGRNLFVLFLQIISAELCATSIEQDLSPVALWQGEHAAITQITQETSHHFVFPFVCQGRCHNSCPSLVFAVFSQMHAGNTHSFSSRWVR